MAISKAQIKYIRSLHLKKYRQMYGKFLVEGDKTVRELLLSRFKIDAIYALNEWIINNDVIGIDIEPVTSAELSDISTTENPHMVVAIAEIPAQTDTSLTLDKHKLYLACDQLNDPGNAGTIIRTADWFGIDTVMFSPQAVDVYNPKVVSAAKGSLFRTNIVYQHLEQLFEANRGMRIYGSYMDGLPVYTQSLADKGVILIGNEANGISDSLSQYVTDRISVPSFGYAESLNAGVAAGILMSEFARRRVK